MNEIGENPPEYQVNAGAPDNIGRRIAAGGLARLAEDVLRTPDPGDKADATRAIAACWADARAGRAGDTLEPGTATPPDIPARPEFPELLDPRDVPRRRTGTLQGRVALMHAIAHIELNAIDLHLDIIARFSGHDLPLGFFDDWISAAADEARHFTMINTWLHSQGSHYGALPAHAGMWRGAIDTARDLPARLAVVPMVLEARGLDVTPGMIALFDKVGDTQGRDVLQQIWREEVAHVAFGSKWFHFLCGRDGMDPKPRFHALVRKYFHGALKPPFDEEKRAEAGMPPDFYWPLVDEPDAAAPRKSENSVT